MWENQGYKETSIRSVGVLGHVFQSPEMRQVNHGGYIVAPSVANSRFIGALNIERPLTTVGTASQSRFVTPDIRQMTRGLQTKYSSHSINDQPSIDRTAGDRPSGGVEFDYQRQYQKLMVKYRKKEEKNKRHLKDLTNQIIVKDSIITNFEQEIANYRSPDSQRLQQELDQLKKNYEEQQQEAAAVKRKLMAAEQEIRSRDASRGMQQTEFHKSLTTAKDSELLQLRRRIEELEAHLQQSLATSNKSNKDRDYFLARVADCEKQIRLKDDKLNEVETSLSRTLSELKQVRVSHQRLLQLKDSKTREHETDISRRLIQVADLQKQLEAVPQQLALKLEEQKLEFEKKLQAKDLKIFETDSERLKAMRQLNDLTKQMEIAGQQFQLKSEQQEKALQSQKERIDQLSGQILTLNKQNFELRNNSKAEVVRAAQQRDAKINELEMELDRIRQSSAEVKRQLDNIARHNKLTQERNAQSTERNQQLHQLRIEALEREIQNRAKQLTEQKAQQDSVLASQIARSDEVRRDLLRELQDTRDALAEAERANSDAKATAAQSSGQLAHRVQELERTVKLKDCQLEQARKAVETNAKDTASKSEEAQRTYRLHIDMKDKRIAELQQKISELTEEIRHAKLAGHESNETSSELRRTISSLTSELDGKKMQYEAICRRSSQDQSDRDSIITQKSTEIKELRSEVNTIRLQLTRTTEEATAAKSENELLRKLIKSKDQQITTYAGKTSSLSDEAKEKHKQVNELTLFTQRLETELTDVKTKLGSQKEESDGKVNSLAVQTLRLQNEIQSLKGQHAEELKALQTEFSSSKSNVVKLQSELSYAKHSETSLKKVIESKEQEIVSQRSTIEQLRKEHVSRQEESQKKSVEQLMSVQQDRQRLQSELNALRLEHQTAKSLQSEKQKEMSTLQARVTYLTNENDSFRREVVGSSRKLNEAMKQHQTKLAQLSTERTGHMGELMQLKQKVQEQESAITHRQRELKSKIESLTALEQKLNTLERAKAQQTEQLTTLNAKIGDTTKQLSTAKQDISTTRRLLEQKEQERQMLAEALIREKKQNEQLLTSNQSTTQGHETVVLQLQESKKELSQQLEAVVRLRSDLDQTRTSQLKESQQRIELERQIDAMQKEMKAKNDKLSAQQASMDAMEMIIEKMRKVHDGASQKQAELEQAANNHTEKIASLESKIKELDQTKLQLNEELARVKTLNQSLMQNKTETDRETNEVVRNIQTQMQELQEVSQKVLEKQDVDRQEFTQRLQEKEQYIGQLVETIEQLHRSRSQQTSPMREPHPPQQDEPIEFVRVADFEAAIGEKDRQIDKYKKLLDLQKRTEERSRTQTPRKMSGQEQQPAAETAVIEQAVVAIDYQHKYKALLISMELAEDEAEEAVLNRVETLLSTNSRYEKSVQDLMQKIDWMEQNLNLLNQQNNDFHLELESKDNAAAELSKTVALREKTISELRNYESHLTKKLLKTEELLEVANRIVINLELRLLSDRHEFIEREEATALELQTLQERVRLMRSQGKSQQETTEDLPPVERQGEESVLRSGSFPRLEDQELLANISFLSELVRLRDNSQLERLYYSQEFSSLRQYFTELAREELAQSLTLSQSIDGS